MRPMIQFVKDNLEGTLTGAEVGVAQCTNANSILRNLDCSLYLIDSWEADFTIEHAMSKLEGDANFTKSDSVEGASRFPDGLFDFVYIDADHTYEGVKRDIIAWLPKVKTGGVIGGHDYSVEYTGVMNAVNELVPEATIIKTDWYWRKKQCV